VEYFEDSKMKVLVDAELTISNEILRSSVAVLNGSIFE
jgi:hypothetical protein